MTFSAPSRKIMAARNQWEDEMLDLTKQETESEAHLLRVGGRKDASTERVLFDVELALELETQADAEVVDRALPGVAAAWHRTQADGSDGADLDLKRKPSDPDVGSRIRQGDVVLADGPAELRRLWLAIRSRTVTFRVLMRLFGVQPAKAGELFGAIDQRVRVSVERTQQELPLRPPTNGPGLASRKPAALPEVGQVATAKTPDGLWCGRVTEVDVDAGLVTIADLRETRQVAAEEVTSAVRIAAPKRKTLEQVLARYEAAAEDAGHIPSWSDVLVAVAAKQAPNDVGGVWTLTDEVVAVACANVSGVQA